MARLRKSIFTSIRQDLIKEWSNRPLRRWESNLLTMDYQMICSTESKAVGRRSWSKTHFVRRLRQESAKPRESMITTIRWNTLVKCTKAILLIITISHPTSKVMDHRIPAVSYTAPSRATVKRKLWLLLQANYSPILIRAATKWTLMAPTLNTLNTRLQQVRTYSKLSDCNSSSKHVIWHISLTTLLEQATSLICSSSKVSSHRLQLEEWVHRFVHSIIQISKTRWFAHLRTMHTKVEWARHWVEMLLLIRIWVAQLSSIKTQSFQGCCEDSPLINQCTTTLISASSQVLHLLRQWITDPRILTTLVNRQLPLVVVLLVKCRDKNLANLQILNSA